MNSKIKQIKVEGIIYDITDPNLPDHVRAITQEEIETWNAGAQGNNDYNLAINKPSINDVELKNNKTSSELGLQDKMNAMTNSDIQNIIDGIF